MDASLDWLRIWTLLARVGFGAWIFKWGAGGVSPCRFPLAHWVGVLVFPGWPALKAAWAGQARDKPQVSTPVKSRRRHVPLGLPRAQPDMQTPWWADGWSDGAQALGQWAGWGGKGSAQWGGHQHAQTPKQAWSGTMTRNQLSCLCFPKADILSERRGSRGSPKLIW